MPIDRRRFLALPIGLPAILAWLKSHFSASPSAESIPKTSIPARYLFDSPLQTLIAIEIYLDALRRKSLAQANPLAAEPGKLQGLIREEWVKQQERERFFQRDL